MNPFGNGNANSENPRRTPQEHLGPHEAPMIRGYISGDVLRSLHLIYAQKMKFQSQDGTRTHTFAPVEQLGQQAIGPHDYRPETSAAYQTSQFEQRSAISGQPPLGPTAEQGGEPLTIAQEQNLAALDQEMNAHMGSNDAQVTRLQDVTLTPEYLNEDAIRRAQAQVAEALNGQELQDA